MLGTGKFASGELMREAIVASETEIVTVALRRADLTGKGDPFANILDFIPKNVLLLPNTSGAMNAEEAVRLARLAVAAGLPNWVKLEIHPDPRYLLPDPIETLKAAEILVKEGFIVLPLHQCRPGAGPSLAGRGHGHGDAAGLADWVASGHHDAAADRDHHHPGHGAGGGGRGHRRAQPCGGGL
jgi:thiazole synthase ThiGH ThiG subunit